MTLDRRQVLKAGAIVGGSTLLAGCEGVISGITSSLGQTIPESVTVPQSETIDSDFHLLNRAGFGPWPGDLARLKSMGRSAWIEEQLHPERIDDFACDLRARGFETLHTAPGDLYEYKREVLRRELTRHTVLRAIYSRRQLYEAMCSFWSDHLNVYQEKGDCIYLKTADDRDVIRKHAFGKFKDLVRASALSPAMLVYLDGNQNRKASKDDVPNENYGRELLELHTLGVDGGYSQQDVYEAARCLTGWRIKRNWRRGEVYFDPRLHDDGPKEVLGQKIPAGGGASDLDRLVEIACSHPSTARHVARKLVQRFVSDVPPQPLVNRVAARFAATGGDVREMMRVILGSKEFEASAGEKIKRPFRFIVSAIRAVGGDTHAHRGLTQYLERMGQQPFQYPTPDGYPEEPDTWLGTMLWRWNFALAVTSNRVSSVNVDLETLGASLKQGAGKLTVDAVFPYFAGRSATPTELDALQNFAEQSGSRAELVGVLLAAPAFQRY